LDNVANEPIELSDENGTEKSTPSTFLIWETKQIEKVAEIGDDVMVGVFPFVNAGPDPIRISSIVASCGCTTADLNKRLYLPGDSGEILSTFSYEGRSGEHTKVISVYVKGDPEPIRLAMKATIPRVLSVKPAYQKWERGSEVEPKYTELEVEVDESVQIKEVVSSDPGFLVDIETLQPGKQYRLKVTPKDTEKRRMSTIRVVTDYPKSNPQTIKVRARVK
jgi:hypothetical protein